MKSLVVGSMDPNAGKTSFIIGLAKASNKSCGYIKPLGDRLVYRKKRVWDYDAALMTNIFQLEHEPENMTVGFEHLKLRFKYDEAGARERVSSMAQDVGSKKDLLLVEGAKSIEYGVSFFLDVYSLTRYINGKLVMVVGGDENYIVDMAIFIQKNLVKQDIDFKGVVLNKVRNVEDFKNVYVPLMNKNGVKVLGMIPYEEQLTYFSMEYLSQYLLARVIAGEQWLNRRISNIFVGAASVETVYSDSGFHKENKLLVTSGDRSDMMLASFEDNCTSAIILTNNILPPQNILAKADEKHIPVLLVPYGVYETARQIESLVPMITSGDKDEINLMEKMVKDNVDVDALLGGL